MKKGEKGKIDKIKVKKLAFWCMNPAVAFAKIMKENPRSIILTSDSLEPLETYEEEIGLQFNLKLENNHVIDKQQVQVNILETRMNGELFKFNFHNRKNADMVREVGRCLDKLSQITPGGVLVFFPSHGLLNNFVYTWKREGIL